MKNRTFNVKKAPKRASGKIDTWETFYEEVKTGKLFRVTERFDTAGPQGYMLISIDQCTDLSDQSGEPVFALAMTNVYDQLWLSILGMSDYDAYQHYSQIHGRVIVSPSEFVDETVHGINISDCIALIIDKTNKRSSYRQGFIKRLPRPDGSVDGAVMQAIERALSLDECEEKEALRKQLQPVFTEFVGKFHGTLVGADA